MFLLVGGQRKLDGRTKGKREEGLSGGEPHVALDLDATHHASWPLRFHVPILSRLHLLLLFLF
jgi:hypothetical protein